MYKIINERGNMEGHELVEIVELEELGLMAIDHSTSNGESAEAWQCSENGRERNPGSRKIRLIPVQEPSAFDTDGEPTSGTQLDTRMGYKRASTRKVKGTDSIFLHWEIGQGIATEA